MSCRFLLFPDGHEMRLCIADPPYLGRAVRWYGQNGCGDGYGLGQADNHVAAAEWDKPAKHRELVRELLRDFDGFAIAMSVHSLSTYLAEIETDSRSGFRVLAWHKPSSYPSGSRIQNVYEPVLVKVPDGRRGYKGGLKTSDVFSCNPPKLGFAGAKPEGWTHWLLDVLGYAEGDTVTDLFAGTGSVARAIDSYTEGMK
jgi:hypothetical protein